MTDASLQPGGSIMIRLRLTGRLRKGRIEPIHLDFGCRDRVGNDHGAPSRFPVKCQAKELQWRIGFLSAAIRNLWRSVGR